MKGLEFIRKIKIFAILSLIIPLFAINACLLFYKTLGHISIYPDYLDYSKDSIYYDFSTFKDEKNISYSFTNCPTHNLDNYYLLKDGSKILSNEENIDLIDASMKDGAVMGVFLEKGSGINGKCVKHKPLLYKIFKNFNFIESFFVLAQIDHKQTFSEIKNPYFYGEVSISRTARFYPATLIFKPLIILGAIFLFLYWRNNLNFFNELKNGRIINNFSKKFFYFGVLSVIFLILHATFLGMEFESKLFPKIRRLIIILFILFEVTSQILLTLQIFKFREKLKEYINAFVLKIKIAFVTMVFFTTLIALVILIWFDPSTSFKHMLEWNYFSVLLLYYFFSRLLWR